MLKAHRLVYHSTLGLRVINKKKKRCSLHSSGDSVGIWALRTPKGARV